MKGEVAPEDGCHIECDFKRMLGRDLSGRESSPCPVSQEKVLRSHLPPQVSRFCRSTRWTGHEHRGVPSPLAMQMWEQPPLSRAHGWAAVETKREKGIRLSLSPQGCSPKGSGNKSQARTHKNGHSCRPGPCRSSHLNPRAAESICFHSCGSYRQENRGRKHSQD